MSKYFSSSIIVIIIAPKAPAIETYNLKKAIQHFVYDFYKYKYNGIDCLVCWLLYVEIMYICLISTLFFFSGKWIQSTLPAGLPVQLEWKDEHVSEVVSGELKKG